MRELSHAFKIILKVGGKNTNFKIDFLGVFSYSQVLKFPYLNSRFNPPFKAMRSWLICPGTKHHPPSLSISLSLKHTLEEYKRVRKKAISVTRRGP